MKLAYKTNYIHFLFISILSIHYVLPLIFIGQVAVIPNDILEAGVVYDHVIGKIYKGDFESINLFLSGEIKWYYLEKIFYPINILHYFLSDKTFYFTEEILKKLLSYFSFYIFAKSLNVTKFNSALGGILYSAIINVQTPFGLGLPLLPYILYLFANKNSLRPKHYFILFLTGLNSSLAQDFFIFVFLIPLSLIINKKKFSLNLHLKIFLTILIPLILSSLHIIINEFSEIAMHREAFFVRNDLVLSFTNTFAEFFSLNFNEPLFIFWIPLKCFIIILLTVSLFTKQKNIKLLLYFIFFILILESILNSDLMDNFFIGIFSTLKGFSFGRIDKILSITLALIFILTISISKSKKLKNSLYIFVFFSIISAQLITPLPAIGEYFVKKNIKSEKVDEIKKSFFSNNYMKIFKIMFDKKNYEANKVNLNYLTNKTFDNYYKYKEYIYIKDIVKNSRIISVGFDPMIAVMNDIKVIDGYHSMYPLNYKKKFRKIIEKELENNKKLKEYYDNWGSRVYAFYSNKNNLLLNFHHAKKIGASYVISKFPIENENLKIVCYECNDSKQIFLYKIL